MSISTSAPTATSAREDAIALVAQYYAAFNRQDWDGMLQLLDDNVAHDLNQGRRETGKAAFSAFLQRMDASYREELRDIMVMAHDNGARAGAEYVVHGEYLHADEGLPPAHGQRYILPGGAFFDIRGGRICRVSNYYNLEDWIAQVRV